MDVAMNSVEQSRRFGVIGCTTGLVALLVSALTQLVPGAYLSGTIGQTTWSEVLSTGAAGLGVLAIALAVIAIIAKEGRLLSAIAAVLGALAIAVQIWWVLIIMAVAIIILNSL